jgi:hypothetical protein
MLDRIACGSQWRVVWAFEGRKIIHQLQPSPGYSEM